MKYSYTLLKKLVPAIKSKKDLIEKLNLFLFEAENLPDDSLEVAVSPNRFSSAGHWGLAIEIAAIYGGSWQPKLIAQKTAGGKANFQIEVRTDLCRRIAGQYFEGIKIKPSPKWLQNILETCGVRSINNLVDITNYVMLETGQPLHAFDFNKVVGGKLIVRPAQLIEEVIALDGQKFKLDQNTLVIADEKNPLDIAGVKGGKRAEINDQTQQIILTAANFDGPTIYKTSRKLNLITDASTRNAHNLTPALIDWAMARAAELIVGLANGQPGKVVDVYLKKYPKRVLKFDIEKFNQLSGLKLKEKEALNYLKKLGFGASGNKVAVPAWRDDIERLEDLAEEVMRLYGYNHLPTIPPHVPLLPSGYEEGVSFKDKVRKILTALGLSEVYNYSFIGKKDLDKSAGEFFSLQTEAIINSISADFEYLRPSLAPYLLKNIDDNFRFFNQIRIFEIGHVFSPEKVMLGITLAHKKETTVLELKGLVDETLEQLGLVDRHYPDLNFELSFLNQRESLRIESDHSVIGYIGSVKGSSGRQCVAEIDLDKLLKLVTEEKEYEPLSKYPSIMRDMSLLVPKHIRVNQIMELIENAAPHYLDDVDLIDFYEDKELGESFKSLTFRLVFLADDRTLTDKEVDKELEKITGVLINQLGVEVR